MKIANTLSRNKPPSQLWHIGVGEFTGDTLAVGSLAVQVYVCQDGDDAGKIEMDVREIETRRIVMNEAEAEALAHVFARLQGDDSKRIAAALLDAAHLARQSLGQSSERTKIETLG